MSKNLSRHIASFVVFAAFLILALGSTDTDTDTQKVRSQTPSYALSANQLYDEYNSNEVAADSKYKAKVVIVTGTIQSIGKDMMDNAYIVIGGDGFLAAVQCTFTKSEQSSVARLSKGQQVRVKGEVAGKMGNVLVNKCSLQ